MNTSSKLAIGFGVSCGVLIIILITVLVLITEKVNGGEMLKTAIAGAFNNKNKCNTPGVDCRFIQDTTVSVPTILTTSTAFSVPIASFGAQLTATLEAATMSGVDPKPLPNTQTLALISTAESKNICWIVQTAAADQIWIVFRGTETDQEWKSDFDTEQVTFFGTDDLVHRGFNTIYDMAKGPIRNVLASHTFSTLLICGHSLGAALSILCAADFIRTPFTGASDSNSNNLDIRTYVFAPPKVGNQSFVNTVSNSVGTVLKELNCVANQEDVVPTLPLSVEPNFSDPGNPSLYAQFPLHVFTENWGSLSLNHMLPVYIKNLSNLTQCSASHA